ncbi:MAG: ATP-binding cassette domain-containing protein, partial [Ktedonobacterales bacterium]|nr:ATP-binding cassette domain-containing protein [Ktedonobacterales bacterium]
MAKEDTERPSRERGEIVALSVQRLSAWYGTSQALFDITLEIAPLSVTALIGPSGCGKSTFVRCLNRMHEEVPGARVKGSVLVEGTNIYAPGIQPRFVRRHIGMVFQQPNVLPTKSIFD